jgi:hypothetical protein
MDNNLKFNKMPILEIVWLCFVVSAIFYFSGLAIGTFHGHLDNTKSYKVTEIK